MLVRNHGSKHLTRRRDFRRLSIGLLHENHGESDEGSLANKVDWILGEWLQKTDRVLGDVS